jgi:hypothetical protein
LTAQNDPNALNDSNDPNDPNDVLERMTDAEDPPA